MSPRWAFDRIYCFEPAPSCWPPLEGIADGRVEICHYGLFDHDGSFILHNPGSVGASLSADKDGSDDSVTCEFRDVSEWFSQHISPSDEVFLKLNVEGSEYEIIRRLYDSNLLTAVDHLLVHFDVRKVPGRAHLEEQMHDMLNDNGLQWVAAERVIFGSVARGTRNWLEWSQSPSALRPVVEVLRRAEGRSRVRLAPLRRRIEGTWAKASHARGTTAGG